MEIRIQQQIILDEKDIKRAIKDFLIDKKLIEEKTEMDIDIGAMTSSYVLITFPTKSETK